MTHRGHLQVDDIWAFQISTPQLLNAYRQTLLVVAELAKCSVRLAMAFCMTFAEQHMASFVHKAALCSIAIPLETN